MKTGTIQSRPNGLMLLLALLGILALPSPQPGRAQTRPAWQERWNKVQSDMRKEGKVQVMGPPGEEIREAITQGFKKAFPDITIEYSGGRTGEQATKLKAERDGGVYSVDVILGGPTTANFQLKPIGALDPIRPALVLPEVTDVKNWRDNRLELSDKEGLYNLVFVSQTSPSLIYNPKLASREEIEELYKLLDPKWKGKIVINDPLVSGSGVPFFRHIWTMLGPEKGKEFYRKIRDQAGAVDRDQRRQIEWIAQGKYAILLAPSEGVLSQLLKRGLKFEVLQEFKDYGTYLGASFGTVMLINRAPHPNAAAAFVNWILTKEGQTRWSKAMNHLSRRLDVPTDHLDSYTIPRPGGKYWSGYTEEAQTRSAEEEALLNELFKR